jgi:hypothetical protein
VHAHLLAIATALARRARARLATARTCPTASMTTNQSKNTRTHTIMSTLDLENNACKKQQVTYAELVIMACSFSS